MKKNSFLVVMLGMALAFALVLAGCSSGSDDDGGEPDNGGSNPFVGSWNGTATLNGQSAPCTLSATDSTWEFHVPLANINESGTYTYSGTAATLFSGGAEIGTATVSGGTLYVVRTDAAMAGSTAELRK
jgi:hypothetical protein